jgi:eukaryotic-like serine/threonine-protein kinase
MRGRIAKRVGRPFAPARLSASSTASLVGAVARLRTACAVWVALWTLGLLLNNVVGPLLSPAQPLDDAWPYPANPIAIVVIAVSVALFTYLGRPREAGRAASEPVGPPTVVPADPEPPAAAAIPTRRLLDLALGYEVFLAAAIGVVNQWTPNTVGLSWIAVLILVHPLIVPDAPGRTLVASLAAASMDPLGLAVTAARGVPLPDASQIFWASLPTYVCALLAVLPAGLVSRLGRELSTARELGSYRLGERLAGGAMGEVYRAEHRLLARPAAIKLIRPALMGAARPDERARLLARFELEAQAIAQLRSPHTVALYDYGITEDGTLYTVMELLEGFDLDTFVRRFGPVPAARTVFLLQQVCDSLGEAHEKGLVHRDVKPSNVFIGQRGRSADFVTVLDFGLVKALRLEPTDHLTAGDRSLTGTPAYMAPEQALGEPVDARSDLYAVGCLAFFLLTGHDVFKGPSAMAVVAKHVREPAPPPSSSSELAIPTLLDEVVLACLDKDPARRPASADELSRRLAEAVRDEVWTAERATRWWQTHRPVPAAGASSGPSPT